MLLNYKSDKLPNDADLEKLQPLVMKRTEVEDEEAKKSIEMAVNSTKKRLSISFEEYKDSAKGYFKSDEIARERYETRQSRDRLCIKKYANLAASIERCFYKLYNINPKFKVPAKKLTDLGKQKHFEHEFRFYSCDWQNFEASIMKWDEYKTSQTKRHHTINHVAKI